MTLLSLQGVGKAYADYGSDSRRLRALFTNWVLPQQQHWVLRDVSFSLEPGESLGVVGRNGAGKSTLLKLITGTVRPTEGTVAFAPGTRVAAILELGLGFVADLTGRENARHTAELMGIDPVAIEDALPGIADFADIGEYFDQPLRTYSSGMQARVAFATVTAFQPDLLIVDEALSVGDAFFQAKCYARIAEYRRRGMALILVTHAIGDVTTQCDRALLLGGGRLLADGSPADVTNRYFDQLFAAKTQHDGAASKDVSRFVSAHEALFATRPGYRKDEHRWGDGGASILDFRIAVAGREYPPEIESGAVVEFACKVQFTKDCMRPLPGLLIKSLEGVFIYGANAQQAQREDFDVLPPARAGEVHIYQFEVPMLLNQGDYLISFGIADGDANEEPRPLERRYDAVLLHVTRRQSFWGLVDLQARFSASRVDSHA